MTTPTLSEDLEMMQRLLRRNYHDVMIDEASDALDRIAAAIEEREHLQLIEADRAAVANRVLDELEDRFLLHHRTWGISVALKMAFKDIRAKYAQKGGG